jgi:hypothetical protein
MMMLTARMRLHSLVVYFDVQCYDIWEGNAIVRGEIQNLEHTFPRVWGNKIRNDIEEVDITIFRVYAVYGMKCHMRNSVTYPILRRMLDYTYGRQPHH